MVDIHEETPLEASRDEDDLARFGYKQELKRTLGVFSSFAVAFSYISPSTGIFALFFLGLTTIGGVFIWSWPIVALGQFIVALGFAELSSHYPGRRLGVPVDEVPRRQDVLVVRRLDLPVRRDPHRRRPSASRCRSRSSRRSTTWAGTSRTACTTSGSIAVITLVVDHAPEHLRRAARRARSTTPACCSRSSAWSSSRSSSRSSTTTRASA